MSSVLPTAPRRRAVAAALAAACACAAPACAATYVVSRHHPRADDANPGTPDRPFRTIARAAKDVAAGDTVLIRTGVYRESVSVEASGTADQPIVFRAGPADRVVVTGADLLTKWHALPGKDRIHRAPWPHRFITYNKTFTHPADDFHLLIGRAEQVFVQGCLLRQVLRREQLARGTFYVDLAAKQLYVWPRDNRDLARGDVPVEASTRTTPWIVKGAHVHLKGLRFRGAANRAQHGAVQISGDHNVVEDCLFEKANSIGAQFRGRGLVVRRCVFQHNGQMGFSAVRAHGLRMTGCLVRNNNTKGYSRGWEAGANKIVLCRALVIEHSTFADNAGHGIWFDIGNERCVVRNCLIADNDEAGIFYEISYGLHAHDNVIVGNGFGGSRGAWGADGGISISSSPGCLIERNLLVANKEGLQFREQIRSTPRIDDSGNRKSHPVWNHDHVIRNNVLAYNRDLQVGGWFDVTDQRHWPKAMQRVPAGRKGQALPGKPKAKGGPASSPPLSLEKLNLRLERNLCWAEPGAALFQWGCRWRRHRTYRSLDDVRKELHLAAGSRVEQVRFADFAARDFRVEPDSPAVQMQCCPRGDVPGVRLGVWTPTSPSPE